MSRGIVREFFYKPRVLLYRFLEIVGIEIALAPFEYLFSFGTVPEGIGDSKHDGSPLLDLFFKSIQ